ncbi:MAG: hypothetical protein IKD04_07570 [Clostridia bacterium]|nr:hypothetical protein [Clostridia bacterium]
MVKANLEMIDTIDAFISEIETINFLRDLVLENWSQCDKSHGETIKKISAEIFLNSCELLSCDEMKKITSECILK